MLIELGDEGTDRGVQGAVPSSQSLSLLTDSVVDTVGGDSGRGDGGGSSANQLSGRHACGVEGVDGALDQCHEQRRTEIHEEEI